MAGPIIQKVNPNAGEPGDQFTVTISGDVFTGTVGVSFGVGIIIVKITILNDGIILVKIKINDRSPLGSRDVTLTSSSGTGVMYAGFTVA